MQGPAPYVSLQSLGIRLFYSLLCFTYLLLLRLKLSYFTVSLQDPQPSSTFPLVLPHSSSSVFLFLSQSFSVSASPEPPRPRIYRDGDRIRSSPTGIGRFPEGWNLERNNTECHTAGPGHLPLRGVGERLTTEEDAGQRGWEAGGLRRGPGSPESRDPGEDAASRERGGRRCSPGAERARLGARVHLVQEDVTWGEGGSRGNEGFYEGKYHERQFLRDEGRKTKGRNQPQNGFRTKRKDPRPGAAPSDLTWPEGRILGFYVRCDSHSLKIKEGGPPRTDLYEKRETYPPQLDLHSTFPTSGSVPRRSYS
ncbi:uncharacterized protein LOC141578567 [Camelus bactrianus]|uniref:Uncharacterized protein LOC141578567 n=1 Tax=Camelus bactrianus TaxID=9837 RepID=A0AC58QSM5_CAMBA